MVRDFFVQHAIEGRDDVAGVAALPIAESSKVWLLAQTLEAGRDVKGLGRSAYEKIVRSSLGAEIAENLRLMRALGLEAPARADLEALGPGSMYLSLGIRLAKPYLSRDDAPFHVSENPVKKDKVFRVPMVSPATWKGHFRTAAAEAGGVWDRGRVRRVFGSTKEEADTEKRQGRVRFLPTFFDAIGFEIINPHDRKTRVGKNPILMECAPRGASGRFGLLYVPFPKGSEAEEIEREDHRALGRLAVTVLREFGFSAKKSSGYGLAEDAVSEGWLMRHGEADQPIRLISEVGR